MLCLLGCLTVTEFGWVCDRRKLKMDVAKSKMMKFSRDRSIRCAAVVLFGETETIVGCGYCSRRVHTGRGES